MTKNDIHLQNRHAVVTGGARGIGRAVAERLLASGAHVTIWDQDESRARRTAEELGGTGRTHVEAVDVTDIAAVETVMIGKAAFNFHPRSQL